jgi:AraC family transcriptional activator of pobA
MTEIFKIFKIDPQEVNKIESSANELHSHGFEELIIGIEGKIEHLIDFKSEAFEAPFVSFVTKGKIHRIKPSIKDGRCDLWVIRFKSEFIPETTFQLYAFYHDRANFCLQRDNCLIRLSDICAMMQSETKQPIPDYAILRQLLGTLFTMIEAERRKLLPDEKGLQKTQSQTFYNFLILLEDNYHRSESVGFYAEKLFMSLRNLNLICHNIQQQSVSQIIEARRLIEAKKLLMSTDKPVSEIGYELGYNEKAYFTNAFKKKSGQTPTEFREEIRKHFS